MRGKNSGSPDLVEALNTTARQRQEGLAIERLVLDGMVPPWLFATLGAVSEPANRNE